MIKHFMDSNFLLETSTAQELFHSEAKNLPIIDYHCHLDPKMVAEDHKFRNITELWLGGDHYKWRALRTNGVDEKYITGDASDFDKFLKWAETVPYTMRNPLYHWTHLELRTAFGINKVLNPETAHEIYDECNEKLQQPEFSARGLMLRYNVEIVCTTDDPTDSLKYHQITRDSGFKVRMLPTWRPDKALALENHATYKAYIEKLSEVSDLSIETYQDLIDALQKRHDFFNEMGCRLSDHGINEFYADDYNDSEVNNIFQKALYGKQITEEEARKFKSALMLDLARQDAASGWTQQFHYGPIRNNNTRMFRALGPDTGFDSIGTPDTAISMARFMDKLDQEHHLSQTIIYTINPADNYMVATMIGNFQEGPNPGKIQFGSGWWFNDQKYGIEEQLNALSMLGLLSRFVGMLTDSRSFLSYPRHEYFRRILCNLIGRDIENGELPVEEMSRIRQMVQDISYYNSKRYFKF